MCHGLLIQPPTEGYLGHFKFGQLCVTLLRAGFHVWIPGSNLLQITSAIAGLDAYIMFSFCKKLPNCFPKSDHYFVFLSAMWRGFPWFSEESANAGDTGDSSNFELKDWRRKRQPLFENRQDRSSATPVHNAAELDTDWACAPACSSPLTYILVLSVFWIFAIWQGYSGHNLVLSPYYMLFHLLQAVVQMPPSQWSFPEYSKMATSNSSSRLHFFPHNISFLLFFLKNIIGI